MKSLSDKDLVLATLRGDEQAFVKIVQKYQAMVTGITLGILEDFVASEDAAQDAFVSVWKSIGSLRQPEKLRSWLAQIARNTALKHLRCRKDGVSLDAGLPDPNAGPDEQVATQEEYTVVKKLLGSLPENYRLPLILFYRDDQSTAAVAEALGLSESATAKRLSRGRSLLREQLSDFAISAIKRTAPGAAFTISVAGLIGALTPSSSLAAAAVSQKTSTAATGIMTTTKLISIACGTLAFLPMGYFAQGWLAERSLPKEQSITSRSDSKRRNLSSSKSIDPALLLEWRRMREEAGPGAEGFQRLHRQLSQWPRDFKREIFEAALLADWAAEDPESGLAWALASAKTKYQFNYLADRFLAEWIRLDRDSALAAVTKLELPQHVIGKEVVRAVSNAPLADIGIVLKRVDRASFLEAIIVERSHEDPQAVRDWILADKDLWHPFVLEKFLKAWGESDMKSLNAWGDEAFSEDGTFAGNQNLNQAYLKAMSQLEPAEVLDQLTGSTLDGVTQDVSISAFGELANTDLPGVLKWWVLNKKRFSVNNDPFAQGPHFRLRDPLAKLLKKNAPQALAMISRYQDPSLVDVLKVAITDDTRGEVWKWMSENVDKENVTQLRLSILKAPDAASASQYLKFIRTEENDIVREQLLKAVAEGLSSLAGGSVVEQVLQSLDQNLAHDFRKAAFGKGTLFESPDLTPWHAAYAETSGEARREAALSLGQAMARRDLTAAKKWAREQNQEGAWEGVYQEWVQQAPEEAVEALSLMDESERPSALRGLVLGVGEQDRELAAEWMATGPEGDWQEETSRQILDRMKEEGGESALAWLSLAKEHGLEDGSYQTLMKEVSAWKNK